MSRSLVPACRQVAPLETACVSTATDLLNELHASVRLTVLHDAARFRARVASFTLEASRYTLVSYGAEVELDCTYDLPSESAILCLNGSCTIDLDGERCTLLAGQGIIGRPRAGLRARFSRDCERLVVRTRRRDRRSRRLPLIEELQFGCVQSQAFVDLVGAASRSPALLTCMANDSSVARPFGELITRLLESARCQQPLRQGPGVAPGSLVRAERAMREQGAQRLTVAELAVAAGVSQRSLQEHFRLYRQCTPMQALRDARLDMARELLLAGKERGSVSAVAFHCGFNHLSRFAGEYRQRFGEAPSSTIRRAGLS